MLFSIIRLPSKKQMGERHNRHLKKINRTPKNTIGKCKKRYVSPPKKEEPGQELAQLRKATRWRGLGTETERQPAGKGRCRAVQRQQRRAQKGK